MKSFHTLLVVPPLSSQGLSHERVLPFLKMLEKGQEREGTCTCQIVTTTVCNLVCAIFYCYVVVVFCLFLFCFVFVTVFRHFESFTQFEGDLTTLGRHSQTFCGKFVM